VRLTNNGNLTETTMTHDQWPETNELRSKLVSAGCTLVDPSDAGDATRRWNGALHPEPLLIACCRTAEQVSYALRLVHEAGRPVTIHNAGQDWTGRSLRDGSVVLDLSSMSSISIDATKHEATIGGGVTAGRLNAAAAEHKLVAVIGNDGAVGMAGLFMGGGYGPLMTRFGLACDNLLSAEVVLPDGRIVQCDENHEPDLLWALRGGGGNFGVVTSARIALHDLATALVGNVVFPWPDAHVALQSYAELMNEAPAELFGSAVLAVGPGGGPMVVVSLVWTGAEEQGRTIVADLAAVGTPIVAKADVIPSKAILSLTDGKLVQGRGYDVGTHWFTALSADMINTLIAGFETRTSPHSCVIMHHCHGAATAVPADASAFGQREPHFTALLYAAWEPASADPTAHHAWKAQLMADLAPAALPGGYANLLADTSVEQIVGAYGPNSAKLRRLKHYYDPDGVLQAIPLPPTSSSDQS
jgi:hypothetical protein